MSVGTPLGVSGILMIVLGVLLVVIGLALLIANQNKPKGWYIWFLIVLGTVMGIAGGVMLAIALSKGELSEVKVNDTAKDVLE